MDVIKLPGGPDPKILEGIPVRMWVALTPGEDRVIGYAEEFSDAQKKAADAGEPHPLMIWIPPVEILIPPLLVGLYMPEDWKEQCSKSGILRCVSGEDDEPDCT